MFVTTYTPVLGSPIIIRRLGSAKVSKKNDELEVHIIAESLACVLDVVAAATSIFLDFKQCFKSDSLQTRWVVFPSIFLLSEVFWKLWNGVTVSYKNCHNFKSWTVEKASLYFDSRMIWNMVLCLKFQCS